jgi:hypothetical protein
MDSVLWFRYRHKINQSVLIPNDKVEDIQKELHEIQDKLKITGKQLQ